MVISMVGFGSMMSQFLCRSIFFERTQVIMVCYLI